MTTNESNESRKEQKEQAHQSPLKKPETETAHADQADVGAAAQGHNPGSKPSPHTDAGPDGAAVETPPRKKAMLPEDVRPRGIDVDNDNSSDSTVDTDGKDHDAKRLGRLEDSEVISNASSDNEVPTPAEGLAGIDSRPGGNRPAIQTQDGRSVVIDDGVDEQRDRYIGTGEQGAVEADEEHLPVNHTQAGRKVRIVPEDNGR